MQFNRVANNILCTRLFNSFNTTKCIQGRPMDQAPQGIGGMPPAPTAGYAQQRVQAPAATQYGGPTASAGYPQQQPQQQYQQQTQGYGELSDFVCVVVWGGGGGE